MRFRLEFSMDNAAFSTPEGGFRLDSDSRAVECARILSAVAVAVRGEGLYGGKWSHVGSSGSVRDSNGNSIGSWEVTGDE